MPGCFEIEYSEPAYDTCHCCGQRIVRLTRFIKKHGDAYGVCYALFTEKHSPPSVDFAVSFGEWWGDGDKTTRRCFTVKYQDLPEAHGYMLRDSSENKWRHAEPLGRFLSRDEALADNDAENLWLIIDILHLSDPVLSPYLRSGAQP